MNNSFKIIKYTFYDTLRSWWAILYFLFFMLVTGGLLYFSADFSQSVASILNVILFIVPLVSMVFGIMYYYNSREFALLLMAQPLKRSHLFLGQYLGLSGSLSLSFLLGIGVVFILFGNIEALPYLCMLMVAGAFLTFIFTALALWVGVHHEDRTRGFGLAILIWLFALVIYDGLFLAFLFIFEEYPLDKAAIGFSLLNPVDLARIMVMLRLETAALLGYTGAVFNKFFGAGTGIVISLTVMSLWILLPLKGFMSRAGHKDF